MSSEDKIYVDANQPATLIDGDKSIDCLTLGEAVIALDHLPEPRKSAATIKVGDRVYTAAEIDRLHHKPTQPLRVLVDLQKIEGANGEGEVVLTYQCARPTTRQVGAVIAPDIENYFETEKLPYKTYEEGEDLVAGAPEVICDGFEF
jgi:hypothetical protein